MRNITQARNKVQPEYNVLCPLYRTAPGQTEHSPAFFSSGCNVNIPSEVIILNSIVLPHKDLNRGFKNQIIL